MTTGARIGRNIGAVVGIIVFLVFGIVPGFYFGSYGVLTALTHLFGGPVEPNIAVRVLLVVGVVLGIFCVGAVSVVVGSVFGTVVGYLTEALTSRRAKEATVDVKSE